MISSSERPSQIEKRATKTVNWAMGHHGGELGGLAVDEGIGVGLSEEVTSTLRPEEGKEPPNERG